MIKPIPILSDSDKARFWAKVDVRGPDECWNWTVYTNKAGYGTFRIGGRVGAMFLANRIAMALDGRDPGDLHALHTCDNPPCVNPAHLFAGTIADNAADRMAKGRNNAPKGERNGLAKLTDSDIRAIRTDPRFHHLIAPDYAVSRATIGHVKRRKIWRHVA